MSERTQTYIAVDWDRDAEVVEKLHEWNESRNWGLELVDSHDITSPKEGAVYCARKKILKERIEHAKSLIMIAGNSTVVAPRGCCIYCREYCILNYRCKKYYKLDMLDYRNFVKYECAEAVAANLRITVLYKDTVMNKLKCPMEVKKVGVHELLKVQDEQGEVQWNLEGVEQAIMGERNEDTVYGCPSDMFLRLDIKGGNYEEYMRYMEEQSRKNVQNKIRKY